MPVVGVAHPVARPTNNAKGIALALFIFLYPFWVSYPVVSCPARSEDLRMAKPSPLHAGDPSLVSLGETIRDLRTRAGLSQEALAHEVGLDRSYVGGIERGEHNLTTMNLLRISRSLGVRVSELLRKAGL